MDSGQSHPNPRALTDAHLCHLIAQGDTSAIGVIYDRHAPLVYGIALKVLGDAQEAEDLTQDIFLKLAGGASYDPKRGALRTFLAVLTRSRALDRVRSRQRKARRIRGVPNDTLSSGQMEPASAEPSPIDAASQREESQEVQTALGTLSDNQRQVLQMTYYDGLTQTAIAERLNIPVGTVKSRARRGLINLRQAIEEGNQ
ncbi:MAG: sigma-70 family RNA polymerase sigma factor [Elainellaceae cyanobacterium]